MTPTIEDVLSKAINYPTDSPKFVARNHCIITVRDALKAMTEWASLSCDEKDKELAVWKHSNANAVELYKKSLQRISELEGDSKKWLGKYYNADEKLTMAKETIAELEAEKERLKGLVTRIIPLAELLCTNCLPDDQDFSAYDDIRQFKTENNL